MWRFSKLNAALANPVRRTEDDAAEYGKGRKGLYLARCSPEL